MSSADELVGSMPNLTHDSLEITSPEDEAYNCIAWAADDDTRWWWPAPWKEFLLGGYYWPHGLSTEESLASFVLAFELEGYHTCDSPDLEAGWEKVVIYVDEAGMPTHAARQTPDGRWTSKLGADNDVTHETPECVGGSVCKGGYGHPAQYLRRPDDAEPLLLPDRTT